MKQEILAETQFVWANSVIESMLLDLSDQVVDLQSALEKYLKKEWSWERLPNLVKASLIEGVFEIKNTTIPKAITIDSITEIVKNLQPDWDYKFVNAILDNFQKD
jgi:N utilization substance protein B